MIVFIFVFSIYAIFGGSGEDTTRQCWTSSNNQPARYFREGSRIDRGRYWYECQNAKEEPRGCFDDFQRRLRIGETFKQGEYEAQCVLDIYNELSFKRTACVPLDGGRYTEGEIWNEPQSKYWSQCDKVGNNLIINIKGCVLSNGNRVDVNYDHIDGRFWYKCKRPEPHLPISMCPSGCVDGGIKYKYGESWQTSEYKYMCAKGGKRMTGCIVNGRIVNEREKYEKNGMFYTCSIDYVKPEPIVSGCAQRDQFGVTQERCINCEWIQDDNNGKLRYRCVEDNEKKLKIEPFRCIFNSNGRDFPVVDAERYTMWFDRTINDNVVYACKKRGSSLQSLTFTMDELSYKGAGLTYVSPSG